MINLLPSTTIGLLCIYLSLAFFPAAHVSAAAIQSENDGNPEESGNGNYENLVTIMMGDYDPEELFVSTDGSLAHVDFAEPRDVSTAMALSSVSATCFFWRYRRSFKEDYDESGFVSQVFSTKSTKPRDSRGIFMPWDSFDDAERVYCYDASREDLLGDTFTLFFDLAGVREGEEEEEEEEEEGKAVNAVNREGRLLRIIIEEREQYVEFPLYTNPDQSYAQLGVGSRAQLITEPLFNSIKVFEDDDGGAVLVYRNAGCFLIKSDFEQNPDFQHLTTTKLEVFLEPTDIVDSIVCFRRVRDSYARDRWLREKYEGRSALLEDREWYTAMNESYYATPAEYDY